MGPLEASPTAECPDSDRTYTREQVADFLTLLALPLKYRNPDNVTPGLSLLRALHTHMISTVPYETLSLHYSTDRRIHLDPQRLFQKIVGDRRGRGGYCLHNNLFFLFMLRDLGFHVYPVGVRSRTRIYGTPGGDFQGWYVVETRARGQDARKLGLTSPSIGDTSCWSSRCRTESDGSQMCALVATDRHSP